MEEKEHMNLDNESYQFEKLLPLSVLWSMNQKIFETLFIHIFMVSKCLLLHNIISAVFLNEKMTKIK